MQPMNTARMGACLCYVTSSNLNKVNKKRSATPAELDKISKKSINLNDSVNENNETDIDEKREE